MKLFLEEGINEQENYLLEACARLLLLLYIVIYEK